jgi:flagellar basal body-associated protein FliL
VLKRSKIVVGVAVVFLFMATMMRMTVFAAEDTNREPELSVQTDKSEYSDSDNITEIVKVNNLGTNPLTNIEIKVQMPEGYVTEDGKGSSGERIYTITQIAGGDTSETSVVLTPKKADQVVGQNANNNTKTGDSSDAVLWGCILLISAGLIVFVVKKKRGKKLITLLLVITMIGAVVPAICMSRAYAAETGAESKTITATKDITVAGKKVTLLVKMTFENQGEVAQKLSYDGYNLKWQDDFNDATLNRDDWNVETHPAGWVNAEKQEYVDSDKNIYLEDGKLVLKPIKTVENGVTSYTSGRITTKNKKDFKYGIF